MSRIEQILCTHCTSETAVFGQGYTVRAASQATGELKEIYSKIFEPLLHGGEYLPPLDTPDYLYRTANAYQLPIRLAYRPNYTGYTLLGQSCYRTQDSSKSGRIGSYFAHFLYALHDQPWLALDCLRLWKSPLWTAEDTSRLSTRLNSFASFDDVQQRSKAGGLESALEGFLTASGSQLEAFDPHGLLPVYCRRSPVAARRGLLARLVRGFLELDRADDQWLLLVADPDLAALLFFGILRLIPASVLGSSVSFSTFETDLANLPYTLVATTFYDPYAQQYVDQDSNVPEKAGFILDLFRDRGSPFRYDRDQYPQLIMETLADQGWQGVKLLLQRCQTMQLQTADDLEWLAELDRHTQRIFPPHSSYLELPEASPARDYAACLVEQRLLDNESSVDAAALAAAPNCTDIIELLFQCKDKEQRALEVAGPIVERLPVEIVERLLPRPGLPNGLRLDLLRAYVRCRGELPEKWLARASTSEPQDSESQWVIAVLAEYIAHTASGELVRLYTAQPAASRPALFRAIASRTERPECRRAGWKILLDCAESPMLLADSQLREFLAVIIDSELVQAELSDAALAEVSRSGNLLHILARLLERQDGRVSELGLRVVSLCPPVNLQAVITEPHLPQKFRADVLLQFIRSYKRLPDILMKPDPVADSAELLGVAVAMLEPSTSCNVFDNLEFPGRKRLLNALLGSSDRSQAQEALELILKRSDQDSVDLWLNEFRDRIVGYFPADKLAEARDRCLSGVVAPSQCQASFRRLQLFKDVPGGQKESVQRWLTYAAEIERFAKEGTHHNLVAEKSKAAFLEIALENRVPLLVNIMTAYDVPVAMQEIVRLLVVEDLMGFALKNISLAVSPTPESTHSTSPELRFTFPRCFSSGLTVEVACRVNSNSKPKLLRTLEPGKRAYLSLGDIIAVRKNYNNPIEVQIKIHSHHWSSPATAEFRSLQLQSVNKTAAWIYDVEMFDGEFGQSDPRFLSGLLNLIAEQNST